MKISEIIKQVPDYKEFLTISELDDSSMKLAEEFDSVEIKEIGKSKGGRKIFCLKIGNGEDNALLFAFPHPNEPIGSMSLEFLARYLAENPEFTKKSGYTWYLIKAIDIDGAILNEGWFKGKFDPIVYAKKFFRTASFEQVEWSFPIKYKKLEFTNPPPETQALMGLMEEIKPKFMYSLHNAAFGGVYYYISRGNKNLYTKLVELVKEQNLPLHLGEPEMPYIKKLHDGVFQLFGVQPSYDFYEANGLEDPTELIKSGTSSDDYLRTLTGEESLTLVCEMPYFYDKAIDDTSLTEFDRRELLLKSLDYMKDVYKHAKKIYGSIKKYCDVPSRINAAVMDIMRMGGMYISMLTQDAKNSPEYEGKATIAQAFDSNISRKYYILLSASMLARLCGEAIENHPEAENELQKIKIDLEQWIEQKIKDLLSNTNFEVIPIQKLVRVQIGSAFITLENI